MLFEKFLTEKELKKFLLNRFDCEIIHDKTFPNYKIRPDFRIEKHKLIIEFDGDRHYRLAKVILEDDSKNKIYADKGYNVIRIPYYVQLSQLVVEKLFGDYIKDVSAYNNYPHGFIASTALLPANFCEIGVYKFIEELKSFSYIKKEILSSLENKLVELIDWKLVYPPYLYNLLKTFKSLAQFFFFSCFIYLEIQNVS